MMDGDRSILSLNMDEDVLQQVFRDEDLVGNVEEFCAPAERRGRRTIWSRCRAAPATRLVMFRPTAMSIPACSFLCRAGTSAAAAFSTSGITRRNSTKCARFTGRPSELLAVRARQHVHALPGTRFPGRQYARPLHAGLREVFRAHGDSFEESRSKASGGRRWAPAKRLRGADPDSRRFPHADGRFRAARLAKFSARRIASRSPAADSSTSSCVPRAARAAWR